MSNMTALRFEPILREYLWGGRRLSTELGKRLGPGDHYAESWEIVDHGADQSVVADGPLAGKTLQRLVREQGRELLGRHHPQRQFPLLFKFIDAHQTLSVQVHPNDGQAARLNPPDLGKTEAWVVLTAEAGSRIYAGLKPGVNRQQLAAAVEHGASDECLHSFEPAVGDCILIEAGTVHAIGAGLVMAEIQQASDTTFRLFDWNRVDRDGRPRALHIRESLDTIDYARGPVLPRRPQPTDRPHVERLVACEKFVVDRWRIDRAVSLTVGNQFHILSVIEGEISIDAGDVHYRLQRGGTLLIPAASPDVHLAPQSRGALLDMRLP